MTRKKPVVKRKVEIVFDEQKRKEFLTGFRKRKNERRKKAKEELERNLKEERIRIRQEVKDGMKHMKKSFEPLRELTEADRADAEEYEDDDVKVKIVEWSTNDLTAQRHMLGQNCAAESESEDDSNGEESDDREKDANCIPGMDFNVNKTRKRKLAHAASTTNATPNDRQEVKALNKPKTIATSSVLKSKRDLDRLTKNKTLKKLKQSKIFKQKERFQKTENQKKARRDKNNTLKSIPKNMRKKKKSETSRYQKGRLVNKKQRRRRNDD